MEQNKTGKYLKYAIGEILLVMVGILLALQVNNWNENRKSNSNFNKLLVNVFNNLETDLKSTQRTINYYKNKDTIAYNVVRGKYSASDYRENPSLFGLIFSHNTFNITDSGYNALMQNSEDIPNEYDQLVDELNKLYIKKAKKLDNEYESLQSTIDNAISRYTQNFPWYSQMFDSINREKRIQHHVNNPIYKNEAAAYRSDAWFNYADTVKEFLNDGLSIYLTLKSILKDSSKMPDFVPENADDYEVVKFDYFGNYSIDNFNVILKENHNFLTINFDGTRILSYMVSKDYFKLIGGEDHFSFKRDESNKVIGFVVDSTDDFYNKVETND